MPPEPLALQLVLQVLDDALNLRELLPRLDVIGALVLASGPGPYIVNVRDGKPVQEKDDAF